MAHDLGLIKDKNLKDVLMSKENLDCLETILQRENASYEEKLKKKSGQLKLGSIVKKSDLKPLLLDIKKDVDSFLKINSDEFPDIEEYNFFKPKQGLEDVKLYYGLSLALGIIGGIGMATPLSLLMFASFPAIYFFDRARKGHDRIISDNAYYIFNYKKIVVFLRPQANFPLVFDKEETNYPSHVEQILDRCRAGKMKNALAHEYAHFLQHIKLGKEKNSKEFRGWDIFQEGHSTCVSRKVMQARAIKENNRDLDFYPQFEDVSGMRRAYYFIADRISKPIPQWMSNIKAPINVNVNKLRVYDLGRALFRISEEKNQGKNVYAEVLEGNFDVLKI